MSKDDFIDLLDFSTEQEDNEDEGTLETIIKNDSQSDEGSVLVSEHKVIESEAFTLRLFKKEDYIDSIEIECACGKVAKVHLEYDESGHLSAGQAMNDSETPVSHQDESITPDAEDDFEDDEFHGGIAANRISPDEHTKIIDSGPADEDQDDNSE